jgi:hypothetical protein
MFSGHSPGLLVTPLLLDKQRTVMSVVIPQPFSIYDSNVGNSFHKLPSHSKRIETMSDNDEFEHEKDNRSLSSESASLSSGTGTDTNHTGEVSNASSISITRAETKAVNRSKIIVLAVIAVAATACGAATYFFTKSEEEDDFHSQVRRDLSVAQCYRPLVFLCIQH